ncbi:MAG TPA: DUF1634 domain-containing protein [Candidatus Angelobacter sp.]|nr:DUF1634 domain-containing protein [Candidatus Angelobacter sp.]
MSLSWTDEKTEQVIGNLLRAGVLLSAFVVLVGGIYYLVQHGETHRDYHQFHGQPEYLSSVDGVVSSAVKLDSRGIIQFGLLLLVLTPIARVLFSAVSFGLEGDRAYVAVSLIVLAVLIYGLLGS